MFKRFFVLFIILISTIALGIVYREDAPLRLLSVELLILAMIHILAILNIITTKFKVWTAPAKIVLGDDKKKAVIRVSFAGGIFLFPVRGILYINASNSKECHKIKIPFNICRGCNSIQFPVEAGAAGLIKVQLLGVRIFEPVGIIGCYKNIKQEPKKILVYPATYPLQVNNCMGKNYSINSNEDSEYYSDHPGDDPTEIFDHREFQEGDKLSRVNWKLSAREKHLMVKQMSDPIQEPVCIVMGMEANTISTNNCGLSIVNSLAEALMYENIRFAFLLNNKQTGEAELMHIKNSETLDEAVITMLDSEAFPSSILEGLLGEEILGNFSKIIYVTAYDKTSISSLLEKDEKRLINVLAVGTDETGTDERVVVLHEGQIKTELGRLWLDIT